MHQSKTDLFQSTIKGRESSPPLSMDEYMENWLVLSKEECFSGNGFYRSFGCSEQAFLSFLGQRQFSEEVRRKIAEICSTYGAICEINLHLTSTYNMCCYCNFTFDTMLKNGYLQALLTNLFDDTYLYSEPAESVEQKSKKQRKKSGEADAVASPSMES